MNKLIKYVPTIMAGLILSGAIDAKCDKDVLALLILSFLIITSINIAFIVLNDM